ncbi:MAG: UDP-N-acetylmuramoyl-L-alanine--D-glutamate ligase [Planctomycetota bacterium]|jgi:UDP-N-acetylmuramoylalanine--D-glutamate ligase
MRVTVMGLGLFGGGAGAARALAEAGHEITVTDLRGQEALAPAVASLEGLPVRFVLGRHEEADFASCEMLVVNPAVKPGNRFVEIARAAGARVTTELELGLERAAGRGVRVLAVTGTNGKSTTCAMLASILSAADPRTRSGGNLGGSLLAEARAIPEGAPLVLEVSSFQLHRLTAFPGLEVAVVTNLSPNHLDWHGSLEGYYAAKRRLVGLLPDFGTAALNHADATLRRWGAEASPYTVWFASEGEPPGDGAGVAGGRITIRRGCERGDIAPLDELPLRGPHDVENALAATAAALAFRVEAEHIAKGLAAFRHDAHRLETVADSRGVAFIDDSASTTPESTIAALCSIEGPAALIAGGSDKGCDFSGLAREIAGRGASVVVMGEAGMRIAEAVGKSEGDVHLEKAGDLDGAFVRAVKLIEAAGGTVLLSPAAASFDEFRNYTERGERFCELARAWAAAK